MTVGPSVSRGVPLGYPLLVVLPLLAILLVLHVGTARHPSMAPATTVAAPAALPSIPDNPSVGLLLVQILTILVATRVCGLAVRPLGQPHVVGEMLAGILLGPSLLGLLAPAASAALFPPSSLEALSALSEVGMVLYMFLVGMDLDARVLRERRGTALLTSHVSIVFPFFLGTALALGVFDRFAPPGIRFTPFALFLVVLVPLYFAFTGLRTRLDVLVGPGLWALALVVLGAAVVGKLGGSALAARVGGVPWREAAALGVLMNTRGLMELVILNVGLDRGVLSPALFAIFVLMAFLTTLMTSPLLSALGVPVKAAPAQ